MIKMKFLQWKILLVIVPALLFSKNFDQKSIQVSSAYDFSKVNSIETVHWKFMFRYNGLLARNYITGSGGGYFPLKKVMAIYMDGIFWSALLRDKTMKLISDTPRVGGVWYTVGTIPGRIRNVNGILEVDPNYMRIFKIKKKWRNLSSEMLKLELLNLGYAENEITPFLINELKQWYADNWKNWPVDEGAPFNDLNRNGIYDPIIDENGFPMEDQGDYPGILNADQVIWFVINDLNENKVSALCGSKPIGLEVQITLWTYETDFIPLAHTLFERFVLVNKSNYYLDSMYVGKYVDIDLGNYSDDLVGCDSVLSLGFGYNGKPLDREFTKFKILPASVGHQLLRGPVVKTGNKLDTAFVGNEERSGYLNLPMTSFAYRSAGGVWGDPPLGTIDVTLQTYNALRGFQWTNDIKNPSPQVFGSGPRQGQATRFPLSGDPVTDPEAQTGDIDGRGWNIAPSDRRYMINTGPFKMGPSESQEIIYAVIGGWYRDYRQSIQQLKNIALFLKSKSKKSSIYLNPQPPVPAVKATAFDQYIVLNWGWDIKKVEEIEEKTRLGYRFEGYNVYQLPDSTASINDPRTVKLATFDRINCILDIESLTYFPDKRKYISFLVQQGMDTGIKRYYVVRGDSINKRPLYRGSTYYFAVTSYNFNPDEEQKTLESKYQVVKVTVQDEKPGSRYPAQLEDELEVNATINNDVQCKVKVVDPKEVTGHQYQVYFTKDMDSTSSTFGEFTWNVKDLTTGEVRISNLQVKKIKDKNSIESALNEGIILDGLLISVFELQPHIKAIVQVADAEGPLTEDEYDGLGAAYGGNNVWLSLSSPNDVNRFYISAGGTGKIDRLTRHIENVGGHDFELRFTKTGGYYVWWEDDSNHTAAQIPFEAWDVGIGTYNEPEDDIRCLTGGYSGGKTVGQFDFAYLDPVFGFLSTDWIDIRKPVNEQGIYQKFEEDILNNTFNYEWWNNSVPVLDDIIICDFGGNKVLPPAGTVIRFIFSKNNKKDLIFTFTAPFKIENDPELTKKDVEKINVFPNPYYATSNLESNRFTHFVTFNHLPKHAIIRIFTLNGNLVRKLEKNDNSQFYRWDLRNNKGLPVASGLYIILVQMPELGKQKMLKLMVISGEEVIDYF